MRILTVEPGPEFSVADVHKGWTDALGELAEVRNFNLSDRITFIENAIRGKVPEMEKGHIAARMVAEQLRAACFDYWPDLVVITSAFLVPPETYDMIRGRGIRIAVILTESPYEDPAQRLIAARADLAIINDPMNLDAYREDQPNTYYCPQAHDPRIHHPGPAVSELCADFGWVGTAFPSRLLWFQSVDWTGVDVALGGNWQELSDTDPLNQFLLHDKSGCFPNNYTADLYRSVKASVNLYRKEGAEGHSEGWAMGPREVELAACGTFFLREPRPESDEVLAMLPTFDGPEDFREKLDWYLTHDDERTAVVSAAMAAVSDRTFINNARFLLDRVNDLPSRPAGR